MSSINYWRTIRSGWKVILALTLIGFLAGGASAMLAPKYVSSVRMFVSASVDSKDPEELFQRNQIAGQRVFSYVQLITTTDMLDRVIQSIDKADRPDPKSVTTTALTIPNTVIIDVQVKASTPEDAQRIARAYGTVVPAEIKQVEATADDPTATNVTVTPISEPKLGVRSSAALVPSVVAGGALGAILGSALVLLLASRRRSRDEV